MTSVREQLAEALMDELGDDDWTSVDIDVLTGALLPVVDRIAKERAADEIRAIAHRLDDNGDEATAVSREGAAYVHRVLCDCAHALDGKP